METNAIAPAAPRRGRKTLKGHGFDLQAKQIVRNELVRSGISHEELVKRLARMGVRDNVPNLRNKLTRGRFSAPFLLQVMAALDVKSIDLEEAQRDLAKPDRAYAKVTLTPVFADCSQRHEEKV